MHSNYICRSCLRAYICWNSSPFCCSDGQSSFPCRLIKICSGDKFQLMIFRFLYSRSPTFFPVLHREKISVRKQKERKKKKNEKAVVLNLTSPSPSSPIPLLQSPLRLFMAPLSADNESNGNRDFY